jgi:cell fate regulator YaaT (PSP1 superfamily)
VDCSFEKNKIIFYFTAESRVDFRDLVKDLVQKFKVRIELKQIGARQETRIIKGIAICGRPVCCAGILQNLERVTVKMAKQQSMSLNPEKISGLCGRLMCCLAFEQEGYADKKRCPNAAKLNSEEAAEDKQTADLEKLDEFENFQ